MRDSISSWQTSLAQGFASAKELLEYLQLPETLANQGAELQFKTRVPRGFASLMEKRNRHDPLLLQVLPILEELSDKQDYVLDPLAETQFNPMPGLIHKYYGRILLTLTGACAINCRYCFRRHFPYEDNNPGSSGWTPVLQYIQNNPSITEVILSGGDPLMAKDTLLQSFLERLSTIPHIQTLRIHSRIPIVLPERIDESFQSLFASLPWHKVMVMHSNHPRELDERVAKACQRLKTSGFFLFNQSVLLKGVNNHAESLVQLSRRLFAIGVLPYYLHMLDKVQGASHFAVDENEVKRLYQQLQSSLPGYLVPKLAREEAGMAHKTLLV